MKTVNKFVLSFSILFVMGVSVLFSGCFGTTENRAAIYTKYSEISTMYITKVGSINYEITDETVRKEIFNKFSKIKLAEQKKSSAVFGSIGDKGEPKFKIQVWNKEKTDFYSVDICIEYDQYENQILGYFLQRRVTSRLVYFAESNQQTLTYFNELYDNFTPAEE